MKRKTQRRQLRRRGLVVTEGKVTEPQYIELLQQQISREYGSYYVISMKQKGSSL